MTDIPTIQQRTAQQYADKVSEICNGIRRMAERFEREARVSDTQGVRGVPRHTEAAQRALVSLQWDLANLGAGYLVADAGLADAAEAEAERLDTHYDSQGFLADREVDRG